MNKTKKLTLSLFAVCATLLPATAFGGEKAMGVMGGYSSYNNSAYLDVNFQYTVVPHVRFAADIGCSFKHEGKSAFLLDLDAQFPFKLGRGVGIYPLVGFTFNNWSYEGGGQAGRAGGNFGGGFEFYLTRSLKLQVQGKYSVMKDTSGAFIGLGINYLF